MDRQARRDPVIRLADQSAVAGRATEPQRRAPRISGAIVKKGPVPPLHDVVRRRGLRSYRRLHQQFGLWYRMT
jgi:hypothetical protein